NFRRLLRALPHGCQELPEFGFGGVQVRELRIEVGILFGHILTCDAFVAYSNSFFPDFIKCWSKLIRRNAKSCRSSNLSVFEPLFGLGYISMSPLDHSHHAG